MARIGRYPRRCDWRRFAAGRAFQSAALGDRRIDYSEDEHRYFTFWFQTGIQPGAESAGCSGRFGGAVASGLVKCLMEEEPIMLKRNLPLLITILVFIVGYGYCFTKFPGFVSTRVFFDLLTDNAFLGIVAVGMTFVILSGGIDLSVGSVIAFTGVLLAKLIGDYGVAPGYAFVIVLLMGAMFGALMGWIIDTLKLPAFIITLAGMFFVRGMSFIVSEESLPINHPVYDFLANYAWKMPGGGRFTLLALIMLLVVVFGMILVYCMIRGNPGSTLFPTRRSAV